jgi:HSP20 family protein
MMGSVARPTGRTLLSATGWRPSLDVYETAEEFVMLVAVAGIQPEDVEVVVDHDTLRLTGNRPRPVCKGVTRIHQMEIDFGPFSHTVRLPEPVDADAASSTYRDGFLTIRLPKRSRAAGPIPVTVNE